jgi:prephenate dehydrogenase
MAGREQSGPEAAAADLFRNATWAITPSPRAREQSVSAVIGIVESLGANAIHIDPEEHDQFAAAVSHMPLVLSVALFRLIRQSAGWEDAALLAGPGFRDLTRLASGDPTMARDIVETNREAVLHWLGRYREELRHLERVIEEGGEPLFDLFAGARLARENWVHNPQRRRLPPGDSLPTTQDTFGELLLGGRLYEKMNSASERLTEERRPNGNR